VLSWDVGAGTHWLVGLGMAGMVGVLIWLSWRRRADPHRSPEEARPERRFDARPRSARSSLASGDYNPADFAPESNVYLGRTPAADAGARSAGPWWGVPEGFDADAFLDAAKRNFVVLQQAWDAADLVRLGEMMTDDMLANVRAQLAERGDQPNRTDVVTLQATLLGVEDLGAHYLASVEFSGMIREEISAGASPFREIWNLTKPRDGTAGWLLAGVQALQ
jgi:predicted lipid-binding transport protein (Tim44 family)